MKLLPEHYDILNLGHHSRQDNEMLAYDVIIQRLLLHFYYLKYILCEYNELDNNFKFYFLYLDYQHVLSNVLFSFVITTTITKKW